MNTKPTGDARTFEAETVVVADVDPALRRIQAQLLRRLGYTVLEAEGREEAMRLAAANPTIEFLLTDFGLTQANGLREAGERANTARPQAVAS